MTIQQAYNNVASIIEQCIGIGNFKKFEDINTIQESLLLLKKLVEKDIAPQPIATNGLTRGVKHPVKK